MNLLLITFNAGQTRPAKSIFNFINQFIYTHKANIPEIIAIGLQEGLKDSLQNFSFPEYEILYYNQVWAPTGVGPKSNSWQSWLFLKKQNFNVTIFASFFSCKKGKANKALGILKNSLRKGFGIFTITLPNLIINIGIGHLPSSEEEPIKRDICLRQTQNNLRKILNMDTYNFIMGDLNYRRIIGTKQILTPNLQSNIQRRLRLTFTNPFIIPEPFYQEKQNNKYKLNQLRKINNRSIKSHPLTPSFYNNTNNNLSNASTQYVGNTSNINDALFNNLKGYKEANFPKGAPPTCKLNVKKAKIEQRCSIEIPYDTERVPSFCDRIIYQSNKNVDVLFYEPIFLYGDDGKLSDHLGVAGLFKFGNIQYPPQYPKNNMNLIPNPF